MISGSYRSKSKKIALTQLQGTQSAACANSKSRSIAEIGKVKVD